MSEITYKKIGVVAMIVALFAKRHRYSEPVAYRYLSHYGGDKLLVEHYGYLHTQDYEQVVDDLGEYCRRQGGTLCETQADQGTGSHTYGGSGVVDRRGFRQVVSFHDLRKTL